MTQSMPLTMQLPLTYQTVIVEYIRYSLVMNFLVLGRMAWYRPQGVNSDYGQFNWHGYYSFVYGMCSASH